MVISVVCMSFGKEISNESVTNGSTSVNADTIPIVQLQELSQHDCADDCWIAIHGHVYEITEFLKAHPGGEAKLMKYAGRDATRGFRMQHPEGYLKRYLGEENYKGELLVPEKTKRLAGERAERKKRNRPDKDEMPIPVIEEDIYKYYRDVVDTYIKENGTKNKKNKQSKERKDFRTIRQYTIDEKPELSQIFSLNDFEYVAKKVLPELVYTYIQSGSDNEVSRYEDRAALCRIFFRPRCLVDVSELDLSCFALGSKLETPFLIGSFTGSGLIQEAAETLVMKSASKADISQIIPKDSDSPLSEIMEASGGRDTFYQYSIDSKLEMESCIQDLNELTNTYANVKAIFIDVTGTIPSNLEHYKKIEASRHPLADNPAPQLQVKEHVKCEMSWDDLIKIKNGTNVPVILKGILRADDIVHCQKLGFRGVMISGHNGKHVDQYQTPIEVLHEVNGKLGDTTDFSVFVEGDFRRGSDIVKTLCLRGIPVVGKAILFSEIYGEMGVDKSMDILKREISTTMRLIGARSVADLGTEYIDTESLKFKVSGMKSMDAMFDSNYTNLPPPVFGNQEKLKML